MKTVKRRAKDSDVNYLQRVYPQLRGDLCGLCSIVEPDVNKRHLALAECESIAPLGDRQHRCGRKVCRHHLIYNGDLPRCAQCAGRVPTVEDVARYDAKPVLPEQLGLFGLAVAA